ncbi:glycosyltransferase family 39 protein [Tychonema sp. LEGE 07203]|uniref:glycosyltransferase family 39 protein n=1 Tax=Tychonema sp. LEGE 07203 TaxID=1828671 RepID=UPI00187E31FF|nr:glycosyltransferase family 39 protein [Tychonema sp. LEGE 07203]MBE9094230.1 glycosyltransferase family 39 protein [Tychonema sp. LEGE 07203]
MEITKNSNKLHPFGALPPKKLRVVIVILLVLGIFFRFANLGQKVYWIDESYTSLRISGYTEAEFIQQVGDGQIREIQYLQKYQRINSEKSVIDTVKGLALEEPQLAPLYFIATRFWVQLFGDSVAVTRSMSAVFSLLALPCMYWLCLELFESSLTAWLAVSLLAVSPFQIVYAQEARPYSLFVLVVLLSSATVLRAMRLKTNSSWALYAITVALGFYSHLLFALVALGQGIYVVVIEKWRFNKTVIGYFIASIVGFIALSPWSIIFIKNSQNATEKTAWQSLRIPVLQLAKNWILNISRQFLDVGLYSDLPRFYLISILPVILMILIIVGYAVYFLVNQTQIRVWLFVVTLMSVTVAIFLPADLIWGGIRSINTRYMIPCYLGMQISVAYLLAEKIISPTVKLQFQKLWRLAFAAVLSIGIISCCIYLPADSWWNKDRSYINIPIARTVNSASRPLLVADLWVYSVDTIANLLSLSYLLVPQTKLIVLPPKIVEIPPNFKEIFLYAGVPEFKTEIEKNTLYEISTIYTLKNQDIILSKLQKK